MQAASDVARVGGLRVVLVPTMGYLHAGHESLIRRASREGDVVVVSLFVNPTQFGPNEDYSTYPRDFDRDCERIAASGGHMVFAPAVDEIYPDGFSTRVEVDGLTERLCGASRPGHFGGVATVVAKLFGAVKPHAAVFGQKDAQQVLVIRRLTRDLNLDVEVLVSPTIREPDGLARSSRNVYLSDAERRRAPVLYSTLQEGEHLIRMGIRDRGQVLDRMTSLLTKIPDTVIDYVEAVDAESLKPESCLGSVTLLALAVKFGRARLIDNVIVYLPICLPKST
jgi:pantoate--beta-alanine ligase